VVPEDLRVRVIYYESVLLTEASTIGLSPELLARLLQSPQEIAVLRCMTSAQSRVTVICTSDHMRHLMANRSAKDPRGMLVSKREFPLAWEGWGDNPTTGS
jgi:hypothetical protein